MKLAIIFLFALSCSLNAQVSTLTRRSQKECKDFERTQSSTIKDSINDFGILLNPMDDLYTLNHVKVIIYRREKDKFNPMLHVWYFFDKKSNTMMAVELNWGLYNPSFTYKPGQSVMDV
jgi:hypothetical protein